MSERLRAEGVQTADEPDHVVFWLVAFLVDGNKYWFEVAYRQDDESGKGDWVGDIERDVGPISTLFRGAKADIAPAAARVIHRALAGSGSVQDIRWHFYDDFMVGREGNGAADPGET